MSRTLGVGKMIKKLKIRFAVRQDMPAVFNLINELAVFERNPEQVVISINDLKKDGFEAQYLGSNLIFIQWKKAEEQEDFV